MRRRILGLLILTLGFVVVHTARGAWATARVERKLAELEQEGLLERNPPASSESEELRAARAELEGWIQWANRSCVDDEMVPANPMPKWREYWELVQVVDQRQALFNGIDALPEVLWTADGAPVISKSYRLMAMRELTNSFAARAWLHAMEEGDGLAAGRASARSLAVARVRDRGLSIDLMIRCASVAIVSDNIEALIEAGFERPHDLLLPLETELRYLRDERRLDRVVGSELIFLHDYERKASWTAENWYQRPSVMAERLDFLGAYGEHQRAGTLDAMFSKWRDTELSSISLPVLSNDDEYTALHLWSVDAIYDRVMEQVDALQDSI